ncbi:MAG: hypothetical protein KUL83_11045 [Lentimicrobium sp.]|jgi:hypothetical protein|nr:hypothetical protein [Lentimicrobium sp.]MDD2527029.1 hypothetical protein [Lentimicrobiaceae bacterium]MDD4597652.1 hypothetical protein [Lentimicrobiaceae bacterium]
MRNKDKCCTFTFPYSKAIMTKQHSFIILLLLSGLCLSVSTISAQENSRANKPNFKDRLIVGGGIGLQFGDVTLIDLSPTVGYRVTDKLEAGIGITYKYFKIKNYFYDYTTGIKYDLKTNIYGGSLYARYAIIENLFAHIEYERLLYNFTDIYFVSGNVTKSKAQATINSFFIGGGYRQRISGRSYFYIMGLWNLIEDPLSPYSNPVLRMGVGLGL